MSNTPTKLCKGPAHPQPTNVPLTREHWDFYRSGSRAGRAYGQCKLCRRLTRVYKHTLVPAKPLRQFAVELRDRCGGATTVRNRHGIATTTLAHLIASDYESIQSRTAARLLLALAEQRKLDRRNGTSARFNAAIKAQAQHETRLKDLGY